MSTIETRLARLERAVESCGGAHVVFRLSGAPGPQDVERCPYCGREKQVIEVVDPFSLPPVDPPYPASASGAAS